MLWLLLFWFMVMLVLPFVLSCAETIPPPHNMIVTTSPNIFFMRVLPCQFVGPLRRLSLCRGCRAL
jgi:hypothetical protein